MVIDILMYLLIYLQYDAFQDEILAGEDGEEEEEEESEPEDKKSESEESEESEEEEKTEPKKRKNDNTETKKTKKIYVTKILSRFPEGLREKIIEKFPHEIGTGIRYRDLSEGNGKPIKDKGNLTIKYVVRTMKDNKVLDKGNNFSFRLGKREVISGLEDGLLGMSKGGKRQLLLDPSVAYEDKGVLVFTFEITNIQ